MKRFPAKVKGSRLDPREKRHSHRGALDSRTPHCCPGISMGVETQQCWWALPQGLSPCPTSPCQRLPNTQGEGTA